MRCGLKLVSVQTWSAEASVVDEYDVLVAVGELSGGCFKAAERAFAENVNAFSPMVTMRCWISPLSEPDVTMVKGEPIDEDEVDAVTES